ncbi:hypothetical protein IE53DRAFT_368864 [Violaceomyces palustris]|uniref:Uncharacterized protein n=1 Tax=Violaceomyces palustris TaxID=1673888 RepID=A0ACD0NXE0_9BASI|nr:hypothetical protein IE53DRAFT_368864 [Violaceomyces palustris]
MAELGTSIQLDKQDDPKPNLPSGGASLIANPAIESGDGTEDRQPTEIEGQGRQGTEEADREPLDLPPQEEEEQEHPSSRFQQVPDITVSRASFAGSETAEDRQRLGVELGDSPTDPAGSDTVSQSAHQESVPPSPAAGAISVPEAEDDQLEQGQQQQQQQHPSDPTTPGPEPPSKDDAPDQASHAANRRESVTSLSGQSVTAASRRSSTSTTATHSRSSLSSLNKGSAVFVISALETIASSKEAKKSKELKESATRALEMVRAASSGQGDAMLDPKLVFEPLRLACATRNNNLMVTSLDCIGKLVSYAFFAEDEPSGLNGHSSAAPDTPREQDGNRLPPQTLADLVTETVCDCYHETLDDKVSLQIIKALLSSVLSTSVHVHQSSLLKAVRTIYNIFLMSKSPANQAIAQGSLTQMVHHVFGRVPRAGSSSSATMSQSGSSGDLSMRDGMLSPSRKSESLRNIAALNSGREREREVERDKEKEEAKEEAKEEKEIADDDGTDQGTGAIEKVAAASGDDGSAADATNGHPHQAAKLGGDGESAEERVTLQTLETRKSFEGASERDTGASLALMSTSELFVKDAFLVMRALCKLSMKPLGADSERDLKSHAMRSKLLSLHLILTIIKTHMSIFTDPTVIIHSASTGEQTAFVQAVKQYLCLSLSRNAVSSVNQVFEISCEIFWLVLSGMRTKLKKEIEVLLNEIFLPILEMRTSTAKQKSILLNVLIRLCRDPQALVEIYLNYDCDRSALDNIYERLMNVISKISQTHLAPGLADAAAATKDGASSGSSLPKANSNGPAIPPTLSTVGASEIGAHEAGSSNTNQPVEARLKRQSLDCLCSVLRSLVIWSSRATLASDGSGSIANDNTLGLSGGEPLGGSSPRISEDVRVGNEVVQALDRENLMESVNGTPTIGSEISRNQTPEPLDDPGRFESAKQRKTTLIESIRKFNYKPKRGIEDLIKHGFIRSREPRDIARFLLYADGLNKAQIGEYLGEGEPENIAIMHAFVDLMNFESMQFTDALRRFLQAFRLPGEAQKIDRYMLKFAERYVAGNPQAFANADTAYVFAYSVIMLNTDAHNPQVKHRMSLQDFIKNNSGIDDGKNLSEDYIRSVYEEIQNNEIKMKDEVLAPAGPQPSSGIASAIATVGRDLQREAYVLQSEGMANKTEALFRTMVRAQRRVGPQQRAAAEQFFSASHFEHVKPMFEVAWMPFLAGISGPLQESEDQEVVEACLEGFRDAIKIVCLFGLELERNAFVTTLAKFTFLNNLGEMKAKNIEAIKTLLGVAQSEGNYLKGSWREVLTCVSQLERFQLISGGVDERQLPELGRRAAPQPAGTSKAKQQTSLPTDEVVQAGGSSQVMVAADMVFSSSPALSGTAIVDFVQSLSDVSWEEIQSSGMTGNPRLFSLQKLVEISYYNMGRIRMEWSNIWSILGEHFNQVCCHPNASVSAFGLDSLRQLAMRFLEKEELPHFKFQKDFLKPFEVAMHRNPNADAKEMVLQCLDQMIASRAVNIRSGWRTMFGVFSAASTASSERVASYAFDLVRQLIAKHFGAIIVNGSFADLCICATHFSKANKQKISLQATEVLRGLVPAMLEARECPLDAVADPGPAAATPMTDDPMVRFWFPVLFAFYDIIMTGDDLEVRRVALDSLFSILKQHGSSFRPDFWDTVCQEILFPIFAVLRSRSDVTRFSTQEDMSVWLSTTMIQALRNLIDLWTYYFTTLERLLPGLLDLLCACICQENDTLARIGTSCLQQLLEKNVRKLSTERWSQVVDTFLQLFRTTTAHQLFDPSLRDDHAAATSPTESRDSVSKNGFTQPNPLSPDPRSNGIEEPLTASSSSQQQQQATSMTPSERRRAFKQIIVKCVLQLLLIETTHELLQNDEVYNTIPADQLLRLTRVLEESYRFSKRFNADKELRMALWKVGFMKQLPNLLKQESSSAATLVHVLVRMHGDVRETHLAMRKAVRKRLVPLGKDVVSTYLPLDPETQARNITAWTPVVAEVFSGLCTFDDESKPSIPTASKVGAKSPLSGNVRRQGSHLIDDSFEAGSVDSTDEDEDEEEGDEDDGKAFSHHATTFYPLAVDLLAKDPLPFEVGESLRGFFFKVGVAKGLIDPKKEEARKRAMMEEEVNGDRSRKNEPSSTKRQLTPLLTTTKANPAAAVQDGANDDGAYAPTPPVPSQTNQAQGEENPMETVSI